MCGSHYGKAFAAIKQIKSMKKFNYLWLCLVVLAVMFSSCEAIGDIFQAGMTVGIVIVVLIIALVLWLVSKFRR